MGGTWKRLAHTELSSSADNIDTGSFTSAENLKVIVFGVASGNLDMCYLRFNNDSSNNYSLRKSNNGSSSDTNTSISGILYQTNNAANNNYTVFYVSNKSGEEKLVIGKQMEGASGAGNAPNRKTLTGKWITKTGEITSIKAVNGGSGDFAAGSYITVLGASGDVVTDEKTTVTNVPANTRYEETDTRKIYRRKVGVSLTGLKALYEWNNSGDVSNTSPSSDSIGSSGDLSATNSASHSTSIKKTGTASGSFPNDNSYSKTSTSNGANFDFTGDSTVTVWVYRTDGLDASYHAMVSKRSGSSSEYNLYLEPVSSGVSKAYCYITAGGQTSNVATSAGIPDSTWTHLATTISGNTLKFYINGSLDSTRTLTSGSKGTISQPFGVGAISGSGSEGFQGYLDQVTIWDRTLTATEISQIYNSGDGIEEFWSTWKERGTA